MKVKYMYFRSGSQHSCRSPPPVCMLRASEDKRNTGARNQETAVTFLFNCNRSVTSEWVSSSNSEQSSCSTRSRCQREKTAGPTGSLSELKLQVQNWNVRVRYSLSTLEILDLFWIIFVPPTKHHERNLTSGCVPYELSSDSYLIDLLSETMFNIF